MFYHAALQLFINFNKFLQREDPIICVILSQIKSYLNKLFGRFVTVAAIREAQANISSLDYQNRDNQLSGKGSLCRTIINKLMSFYFADTSLFIGITRQLLVRLEDGGDISSEQVKVFYTAVRGFYCRAATYALANLPLKGSVLQNSEFVNFESRESANISQVTFFISRYIIL